MFTLPQPSMALNDERRRYQPPGQSAQRLVIQMANTWGVTASMTRHHIVTHVADVALSTPGGRLHNVVINCHGLPGWLDLGEGFGQEHLPLFDAWRGRVGKIWLIACQTARVSAVIAGHPWPRDGNRFCSGLARAAATYVIASTETQVDRIVTMPVNQIPSFEGLVLSYDPQGRVSWAARNRSAWYDPGNGSSHPPQRVMMPD
jgi:hypothetical protein